MRGENGNGSAKEAFSHRHAANTDFALGVGPGDGRLEVDGRLHGVHLSQEIGHILVSLEGGGVEKGKIVFGGMTWRRERPRQCQDVEEH